MPAMLFHADLHVHSRYSRACSRDCDLEHLAWWAARKGIGVVGTGDITHPAWAAEIREKLVPAEPGLFRLRPDLERDVLRRLPASCGSPARFLLSVEISTIYKRADRTRKVHHLVYVPDLPAAGELTRRLARIGNLGSDGRPILGLDSRDLLEITLDSGAGSYLVPAHVWTPWFAALGSKSGFDSIADCYADLADHVFAVETGLSSDPAMNWRVSALDRYRLVSNSDAHSPPALGREATVFDTELDYFAIRRALETGAGYAGTVEFFPEEGKYHLDGHRRCEVRLDPAETRERGGCCPVCAAPVTVGVLHRVEVLADRADGARPEGAAPYRCLVALPQIVGEIRGVGARSKTVDAEVAGLVARLGPELGILQEVPLADVEQAGSAVLAEAIGRLRRGEVVREAGYDGEYGVIRLFDPKELADIAATPGLFAVPMPATAGSPPARGSVRSATTASAGGEGAGSGPTGSAGSGPTGSGPTGSGPAGSAGSAPTGPGPAGSAGAGAGGAGSSAPRPRGGTAGQDEAGGRRAADVRGVAADAGGGRAVERGGATHGSAGTDLVPTPRGPAGRPLDDLDADQRAAAEIADGPLVVVAGPGTGKTRMLTHRLAHLVTGRGAAPEQCIAITFTRRAAEEMRDRLAALLPATSGQLLVATFHALGLRILREQAERCGLGPGFRIADEAERLGLLRAAAGARGGGPAPRGLLAEVSRLTRCGASPSDLDGEVAGVLARYRAGKRARNLVDLDDLLAVPVTLLTGDPELAEHYRARWQWVSVDEYQDVDETQYRLLRLLSPPDGNLCTVGDPDQAIYGFRGADVGFFLRFRQDFPTAREVRLTRNYRSSPAILAAAVQAIAPGTLVPDRVLVPAGGGQDAPERIVLHAAADERAEAGFVVGAVDTLLGGSSFLALDQGRVESGHRAAHSFADVAVLYRTDAQARALVDAFEAAGIPYRKRSHHRLADQPGVQAILATLRDGADQARTDPRPVLARLRDAAQTVIDAAGGLAALADAEAEPESGPSIEDVRTAVEMLSPLAERSGADLDRFLAELAVGAEVDAWDPRADLVSLLTLHAAKGLEFPVVFVVGCEDDLLPLRWAASDSSEADRAADIAEERRLFFVGITRARTHLVLSSAARRTWHGTARTTTPSRFIADIDRSLLDRSTGRARPRSVQLRLL
jgi:DNA helicase-2/ATP-dependent DNA helicase PcrA